MVKKEKLLDLDLGDNGGKENFYSIEDISEWLRREKDYWSWIGKTVDKDDNIRKIWEK